MTREPITVKIQAFDHKGELIGDKTIEGFGACLYVNHNSTYSEEIISSYGSDYERYMLIGNTAKKIADDERVPLKFRSPFKVFVLEMEELLDKLNQDGEELAW